MIVAAGLRLTVAGFGDGGFLPDGGAMIRRSYGTVLGLQPWLRLANNRKWQWLWYFLIQFFSGGCVVVADLRGCDDGGGSGGLGCGGGFGCGGFDGPRSGFLAGSCCKRRLIPTILCVDGMMSPIYKKYDSADYFDYEFDCQADLNRYFLEEAKRTECQGNLKTEPIEKVGIKGQLDGEKKNRKSWKNSLFSWLKPDKKNKSVVQQSPRKGTIDSELRRGPFSGPVHAIEGGGITGTPQKPTSGHITSLFSSSKRVEDEVPYVSLGQLNNAQDVQSYGPVYLVT
ncbi:unnamed protein product [Fraxinus pennsylvanica]|uniref:Uncharacterized protein n=1 Tax=Fraxinus pennsylvanica TaxID=56036 RepID=A0AAD2DGH0_9LAMI|nr:unnamed protein product [Fraxinus pennsylvanica]